MRIIGSMVLMLALVGLARAHFVFIVPPAKEGGKVTAVFSDSTKPDKAEYLKKIAHTKFHAVNAKGETTEVKAKSVEDVLEVEQVAKDTTCVVGETVYGVLDKKDESFLLTYYSRAAMTVKGREQKLETKVAPLQAVITECKDSITVLVLWQGKPLPDAEVAVVADKERDSIKTDKGGEAKFERAHELGELIAVRARYNEDKDGEHGGKKYKSRRYYATTTFKTR